MKLIRNALPLLLLAALSCSAAMAADKPWTVAVHGGTLEVDRLVKRGGPWWAQVDDDESSFGVSVEYELLPILGLRVMYEWADDLASTNVCPPGAVCPAVAINGKSDFTAWHVMLVPRYALSPNWSAFSLLGMSDYELDRSGELPGERGTEFSYGVGLDWQATEVMNLTLEYQASTIQFDVIRFGLGVRF